MYLNRSLPGSADMRDLDSLRSKDISIQALCSLTEKIYIYILLHGFFYSGLIWIFFEHKDSCATIISDGIFQTISQLTQALKSIKTLTNWKYT